MDLMLTEGTCSILFHTYTVNFYQLAYWLLERYTAYAPIREITILKFNVNFSTVNGYIEKERREREGADNDESGCNNVSSI